MRRKLIKQDAFDKITNESVNAAERELLEAESILARALGKDHIALHCFNESSVVYETLDNTYVHAGYEIKNDHVTFNNIEELVIDESSRQNKRREMISEMIDSILVDDTTKAKDLFNNYIGVIRWNEAKKPDFIAKGEKDEEASKKKGFGTKKKDKGKKFGKKDDEVKKFFGKKAKTAGKDIEEAYITSQNVLDYADYMKVGPSLAESVTKSDDKGNLTDIKIPTVRQRNESKLQRFDWKTLNTKVADSRKKIPHFTENQDFCKAMAYLKRQNKFSDAQGLQEAIDNVVKAWPELLYATQGELAQVIGESLTTAGVKNYDDQICEFMSEGILRKAHSVYAEKVAQILHLASAPKLEESQDPYIFFQNVVEQFYPRLDEKFGLERQVFIDMYEALGSIFKKADRQGDNALKSETASYINEIAAMLNGEIKPELSVAEEAANFLTTVIETNLESGKWVVSNTPHLTVTGDHPDMAKKASKGYSPASDFSGNWGDEAPAIGQDSNNYKSGKHAKEMRNNSWGQEGAGEVFPKLKNPYIPKPFGDFTMKGEKGVDKSNTDNGLWSSSDTWPALDNPYVPKEAGGPGGKGYKMKNGKETDLVVDK